MSAPGPILYHYCSNDAFVSVVRAKSLWLSSLTLSNDTMEGRLVNATLMRVAEKDKLDLQSRERLRESIEFTERFFDGLGFCLSEQSDLLSQWRGYADDGRGVSIGFKREYLDELAEASVRSNPAGFELHRVEYDPDRQEALIQPTYAELRSLIAAGAFRLKGIRGFLDVRSPEQIAEEDQATAKAHGALIVELLDLLPMLFALKSPAFREESEWRLVSMLGGKRFEDCLFRSSRGKIIPYREFELLALSRSAIVEVVLGPKNETPVVVVQSMLAQAGFKDAEVRRSTATYR